MGEAILIFFVLSGVVGYAAHVYYAEERRIKRRLMQNAPVKIQEVQEGAVVKIVGKIRIEQEPLEAPFSAEKCVYYNSMVHEKSAAGGNDWKLVLTESRSIDFWIEDDSGRAWIRAATLKVAVIKDNEFSSGTLNNAPERLERFLSRHGQKSTGWVLNRNLRYKEGIFALDEKIAVLGKARWEHDPDPKNAGKGYRDSPKRLVLDALPEGHVFASDASATLD